MIYKMKIFPLHASGKTRAATNMCVETTAREAFCRHYYVVFLDDCCATVSREEHEATLYNIAGFFGIVTKSEDVVQCWSK